MIIFKEFLASDSGIVNNDKDNVDCLLQTYCNVFSSPIGCLAVVPNLDHGHCCRLVKYHIHPVQLKHFFSKKNVNFVFYHNAVQIFKVLLRKFKIIKSPKRSLETYNLFRHMVHVQEYWLPFTHTLLKYCIHVSRKTISNVHSLGC